MSHRDEDAVLAYARALDGADVWMPPGLRFEVGDRVRIRLSGECKKQWPPGWRHATVTGHVPEFDGVRGWIDRVRQGDDHPIGVMFDRDVACSLCPSPAIGGWFAAAELIPLIEAPDAAATGDRGTGEGG